MDVPCFLQKQRVLVSPNNVWALQSAELLFKIVVLSETGAAVLSFYTGEK